MLTSALNPLSGLGIRLQYPELRPTYWELARCFICRLLNCVQKQAVKVVIAGRSRVARGFGRRFNIQTVARPQSAGCHNPR
jgi:hypothetical protein